VVGVSGGVVGVSGGGAARGFAQGGGGGAAKGFARWWARGLGIFLLSPSRQEDTARGASDGLSGRWGGSHVSASGTAREEAGAVAKILA
jgi:hypothetical protein